MHKNTKNHYTPPSKTVPTCIKHTKTCINTKNHA
jgi:hypothetical protein